MTTRRNDSAPRGAKAPKARAPKPRKTADQKAARAARRTELKDSYVDALRDTAGKLGIDGRSGMTKDALINAILRAEFSPSKRKKVTKTEAKREITAQKANMKRLQGRGPFRTILLRADAQGGLSIYGDLGPYAAARGAQVDAKEMLRRMVGPRRKDAYGKDEFGPRLVHQETVEELAANTGGMTDELRGMTGGEPVDGWVAVDQDDRGREVVLGAAFIVKFQAGDKKQAKIAFKPADTPAALRNNGRRSGRSAGSRANPRVSFKTSDGRSVSFNARRNAGSGGRSTSRANASAVTLSPSAGDRAYQRGRAAAMKLVPFEPNAMHYWQDAAVYLAGHDFDENLDQFISGMNGDPDYVEAIQAHDYLKSGAVQAGTKKVTWSAFEKAAGALYKAARKWQKANPQPDDY